MAQELLHGSFLRDFARAEVPTPCPSLPMHLIWYCPHQDDSAHRWLRERISLNPPQAAR